MYNRKFLYKNKISSCAAFIHFSKLGSNYNVPTIPT